MRTQAIVNPRAGGGRAGRLWGSIAKAVAREIGVFETVFTARPQQATDLARKALQDGVDQIVAVGGDGTIHEVVNGFFDGDQPINDDAILAVMTVGTGGDFRKTLGIERGVPASVACVAHGLVRRIDVGHIEYVDHRGRPAARWFINIASFGLSGAVAEAINRPRWTRYFGGRIAFKWASLIALVGYRTPMIRVRIDDGAAQEIPATLIAACNGQFFGGGMWIAPAARVDDGHLDIVTLRDIGAFDFIRRGRTIYRGEHLAYDDVSWCRGQRLVATPAMSERVALDVDGEAPGWLPATIRVVPGAIRVRVPAEGQERGV